MEFDKYNQSIYDNPLALNIAIIPIRSTFGALVGALSFTIYQIIIFRIVVEYD
jgi:hypothetical protein